MNIYGNRAIRFSCIAVVLLIVLLLASRTMRTEELKDQKHTHVPIVNRIKLTGVVYDLTFSPNGQFIAILFSKSPMHQPKIECFHVDQQEPIGTGVSVSESADIVEYSRNERFLLVSGYHSTLFKFSEEGINRLRNYDDCTAQFAGNGEFVFLTERGGLSGPPRFRLEVTSTGFLVFSNTSEMIEKPVVVDGKTYTLKPDGLYLEDRLFIDLGKAASRFWTPKTDPLRNPRDDSQFVRLNAPGGAGEPKFFENESGFAFDRINEFDSDPQKFFWSQDGKLVAIVFSGGEVGVWATKPQ